MMDLPPLLYCEYKGGNFFCVAGDLDRHNVHLFSKKARLFFESPDYRTSGVVEWNQGAAATILLNASLNSASAFLGE